MSISNDLIHIYPGLRHVYANRIIKHCRRVITKNRQWDKLCIDKCERSELELSGGNHFSLYGVPLIDIPFVCVFVVLHHGHWYFFDVRELWYMLVSAYGGKVNNPYNGLPFTTYHKYRIIRHFCRAYQTPEYQPLELGLIDYNSAVNVHSELKLAIDTDYLAHADCDEIYELCHQLIMWHSMPDAHLSNLVHYYYINGNERNFRYYAAKMILKVIMQYPEKSDDYSHQILRIRTRISTIRHNVSDPISYDPFSLLFGPVLLGLPNIVNIATNEPVYDENEYDVPDFTSSSDELV